MREVVIVSAVRTAVGKFNGGLAGLSAQQIGAAVIKEAISRAKISPAQVEEIIFGNVLQAGLGQNPARQASILAGVPEEVPSFTVNKVCGSGLKSVELAAQAIRAGDADIVVAGGMESMTNAPFVTSSKARWGLRMGDATLTDVMIKDGLWDAFNDYHMGITSENVAEKYGVTREEQDQAAYESQTKACAAIKNGAFKAEIVPVIIKTKKGEVVFDTDEFPREGTTMLGGREMEFSKVMIIGAGQMGAGVAQVMAQSGITVVLRDIKQCFLNKGVTTIDKNLSRSVAKGKLTEDEKKTILDRISCVVDLDKTNCDVDLVIEAATENIAIKKEIFKTLDELCPEKTILASNTSSVSITMMWT